MFLSPSEWGTTGRGHASSLPFLQGGQSGVLWEVVASSTPDTSTAGISWNLFLSWATLAPGIWVAYLSVVWALGMSLEPPGKMMGMMWVYGFFMGLGCGRKAGGVTRLCPRVQGCMAGHLALYPGHRAEHFEVIQGSSWQLTLPPTPSEKMTERVGEYALSVPGEASELQGLSSPPPLPSQRPLLPAHPRACGHPAASKPQPGVAAVRPSQGRWSCAD